MSGWVEIRANLTSLPPDWSIFADAFEEVGCPSSMQTDRPPSISGHLPNVPGVELQVEALTKRLEMLGVDSVNVSEVPDEDWSSLWRHHFKTIRVGRRFVIRPSWESSELEPEDIEIVIEPGLAFGTGDHPTTKLCLELMEDVISENAPGRLLDLGCGSGILAIGARKILSSSSSLSATNGEQVPNSSEVIATDIDPIAVEVAKENFALNNVKIDVFCSAGFDDPRLESCFDLIISNIISATLIRIAPQAALRIASGGRWIVSGIIEDNWSDVREAAEKAGFTLSQERRESGWVGAVFTQQHGHC